MVAVWKLWRITCNERWPLNRVFLVHCVSSLGYCFAPFDIPLDSRVGFVHMYERCFQVTCGPIWRVYTAKIQHYKSRVNIPK